jgi:hypothetical protein
MNLPLTRTRGGVLEQGIDFGRGKGRRHPNSNYNQNLAKDGGADLFRGAAIHWGKGSGGRDGTGSLCVQRLSHVPWRIICAAWTAGGDVLLQESLSSRRENGTENQRFTRRSSSQSQQLGHRHRRRRTNRHSAATGT